MPEIKVVVHEDSNVSQLTAELKARVDEVVADTCDGIADEAFIRAPKRTGYMASTIDHDDDTVWVGAHYASYVNYGTRWQAAQPFFSEAVAQGLIMMRLGLTSIFGHPPSIPVIMDDSVFLMGPLKGVPETWPHRDLSAAAVLRRQKNRAKLGWGDRRWR
jgi:hypothetical protein